MEGNKCADALAVTVTHAQRLIGAHVLISESQHGAVL
jgi:Holliday junction resolvasome RuvABC endonuclease subunit